MQPTSPLGVNLGASSIAGEQPPRRAMAIMAILSTALLGGSILGLLFYRAAAMPKPNRVILVRANSAWHGVELSVEGGSLQHPQVTGVERLGNYVVPFFVWPGKYTLRVRDETGAEIFSKQFDLTSDEVKEVDLAEIGSGLRPTTMDGVSTTAPSIDATP
jgi:hypothetical protein